MVKYMIMYKEQAQNSKDACSVIVHAARLTWAAGRLAASTAERLAASLVRAAAVASSAARVRGRRRCCARLCRAAARDCGGARLARTRLARTRLARVRLARVRLARARLARTRAHEARSARAWPARLQELGPGSLALALLSTDRGKETCGGCRRVRVSGALAAHTLGLRTGRTHGEWRRTCAVQDGSTTRLEQGAACSASGAPRSPLVAASSRSSWSGRAKRVRQSLAGMCAYWVRACAAVQPAGTLLCGRRRTWRGHRSSRTPSRAARKCTF